MLLKEKVAVRQLLTWSLLIASFFSFAGCESVDTQLGRPEGRNSTNDRYQDDDMLGPSLKLSLKPTPQQQQKDEEKIAEKSLDPDY